MNDIERRVAQGLRAYGEGLVMTTEQVDRLERGLDEAGAVAQAATPHSCGRAPSPRAP